MTRSPRRSVRFLYETMLFIVVSVLDILMTHRLIRTGRFHESNPVAKFFYDHWDMNGMVYFKMTMVAVGWIPRWNVGRSDARGRRRRSSASYYWLRPHSPRAAAEGHGIFRHAAHGTL